VRLAGSAGQLNYFKCYQIRQRLCAALPSEMAGMESVDNLSIEAIIVLVLRHDAEALEMPATLFTAEK
jgi:hypothetical protein